MLFRHFILILFLSFSFTANTQVVTATTALTLKSIINNAKSAIIESIKQAESSANSVINNALTSSLALLEELELAYKDNLDYTIAELNNAGDDMINNVVFNIERITNDFQQGLYSEISSDVNLLSSTISGLPFYSKRPYIHEVKMPIIHTERTQPVTITIYGRNLNAHSENNAQIGESNLTYKAISDVEARLQFNPSILLNGMNLDTDEFVDLDLQLKRLTGWWLFKKEESNDYKIPIRIVPTRIGTVEINFTVSDYNYKLQKFHVDKTVGCSINNRNGYTTAFDKSPVGEYVFIEDSKFRIYKSKETDKCSQSARVPSQTCFITLEDHSPLKIETDVTYYAQKAFSGRCSVRFHIESNSRSKTKTKKDTKKVAGELAFNNAYSTILDPKTESIQNVIIKDIYGNTTTFIDRDIKANQANTKGVFSVDWNTTTKTILVEYLVKNNA